MAGLDPELAWDRTPGELSEYIRAYRERREQLAMMLYDLAGTVCRMLCGHGIKPEDAFPGFIQPHEVVMTAEEIYESCLAWCGLAGGG